MRALKIVLLGLSLSIAGTLCLLFLGSVIGLLRGSVTTGSAHATELSALLAGLLDATIFNPIVWLLTIASFALAFWMTKPRTSAH
jgi:hypothetical protein